MGIKQLNITFGQEEFEWITEVRKMTKTTSWAKYIVLCTKNIEHMKEDELLKIKKELE